MRNINILSLVQAYKSLKKESYSNFLKFYGIEIKSKEIEDLQSLIENLYNQTLDKDIFNHFYVGFKILRIGKEFDLLRFGEEYVINVELKSTSTQEKIKNQLERNKYYLSNIGKQIFNFSYISDIGVLYILENNEISILYQ